MSGIKLTKRLAAAAQAVRQGKRAADVGCDHGKLCAFLVTSGIASFCVATDINEKPLAKAEKLFSELGITDRTKTMLCDGLRGLKPGEVDDVVIAGLGFDTIAGIIEDAPWLKDADKGLVLVPSTRHGQLRKWLYANGFVITGETAVFEKGHCYTVMSVQYSGHCQEIDPGFAAVGMITAETVDGARYIERERARAKKIAVAASGKRRDDAAIAVGYMEKELNK